ncbi:MAG: hypothetical protein RI885_2513 [Actinomycetota bacterium]|jgi:hypothetical protein
MDDAALADLLRATLARAVDSLVERGIHDESVAELRPARKIALFTKPPVMAPLGRAWRLGVFLLDREGGLRATGSITRVAEAGHPTGLSSSVEKRRDARLAATRGRFPPGEVVNFEVGEVRTDAAAIRSGVGPIILVDDVLRVRLPTGGTMALEAYLADRMSVMNTDWRPEGYPL